MSEWPWNGCTILSNWKGVIFAVKHGTCFTNDAGILPWTLLTYVRLCDTAWLYLTIFCTCHRENAVPCVDMGSQWIRRIKFTRTKIFTRFQLWAHKAWLKWTSADRTRQGACRNVVQTWLKSDWNISMPSLQFCIVHTSRQNTHNNKLQIIFRVSNITSKYTGVPVNTFAIPHHFWSSLIVDFGVYISVTNMKDVFCFFFIIITI